MKVRIEVDPNLEEDEIVISCKAVNDSVLEIQRLALEGGKTEGAIRFYKGDSEYFFTADQVLFFETSGEDVFAHTVDDSFEVKQRLYRLEKILPANFARISKSAILNLDKIYSISRNITSASKVSFLNSHKHVYISRHYYRLLKQRFEERIKFE
ncbi:MAG: LytTR family transcriptional regulator [Clostridiales bacterium]|nr:LytTR family transcriptional regulator [Clostridiales bacterium]